MSLLKKLPKQIGAVVKTAFISDAIYAAINSKLMKNFDGFIQIRGMGILWCVSIVMKAMKKQLRNL